MVAVLAFVSDVAFGMDLVLVVLSGAPLVSDMVCGRETSLAALLAVLMVSAYTKAGVL